MIPKSIQIDGKRVDQNVVNQRLSQNLPIWEKEIYLFLQEWFNPDDFITVTTSGSTGTASVITRKKGQLIASAKMTGSFFSFSKDKSVLLCLPAKYIAGKMMLVRAIVWEMNLIYTAPKIELTLPKDILFFAAMTPQQVEANRNSLSTISNILIGGAPVNNELEKKLYSLPNLFYVSYGMTETVSHVAIREIDTTTKKPYVALPEIEFSTNENQCLIIHAPSLIDGSLSTTDRIELLSSTTFNWLGRSDFVINSGGLKISPEVVESQISHLIMCPYFIYGEPNDQWGQVPVLLLEGNSFNTYELFQQITNILAKSHQPKKVYFLDEFNRTETGKIKRQATFDSLEI